MSAINERVSPKRLAEIIARAEVCDDSVLTDYRDIESIARELQQYRVAAEQCVGEVIEQPGLTSLDGTVSYEKSTYRNIKGINKMKRMPLGTKFYAAPQVTSVPDESAVFDAAIDICRKSDAIDEHAWNRGVLAVMSAFRACRAAMLNAAPAVQAEQPGNTEQVSQPYKLPEGYLQGYKDGCEWSALMAEANHPQTGDWLFDDPIELAKAIRKGPDMLPVEPGNSPVIPDGWIPVSERMPDETQPVIVVTDSGVVQRTVYQFCDGVWIDWYEQYDEVPHDAFTHWMPLPAAPKQEAE